MSSFPQALRHVLAAEGWDAYTDSPADKGGPTKYGVTLKTLSDHRGRPCTADDVKALTEAEASDLYRKRYWDPLRLDEVRDPRVALVLFDQAVNRGVDTAARHVQAALGVTVDGSLGPKTLAAINSMDPKQFAMSHFMECQRGYIDIVKHDPTQIVFLRGWLNRTYGLISPFLS